MSERFQRVCDLFEEARHLPRGETREAFLDKCDAELRPEVETMLRHHESDDTADPAPLGPGLDRVWEEARAGLSHPAPTRVGPYRIVRALGTGGSGTVYEAEQESPQRRVAIKVLHASIDPVARERFEREGEILAQLTHDGIARVYAIEDSAIVMELVDGKPLTEYATEHSLSVRERMELLASVCDIVAHAHQRGVMHRDLKPHNILVTPDGRPKVLDFGLARRLDLQRPDRTMTGQVLGTLGYMSPEQAAARPDDIDTRTDVYALGVIGYELLSGKLPHETRNRPITEVLLEIGSRDAAPLSLHDKRLRGDVSLIFSKALAKERAMRYQSAGALGEDIQRYLDDEPIVARSPNASYYLRKFVQRNKALVTGIATTILALAVGLAVALRFAHKADRQAAAAEKSLARARIHSAATDLQLFRPQNARRTLDLVPRQHRGWEWAYLDNALAGNRELQPWPAPFDPRGWIADEATWWSGPEWKPWLAEVDPADLLIRGEHVLDLRTGKPLEIDGFVLTAQRAGLAKHSTRDVAAIHGTLTWRAGQKPQPATTIVIDRRTNTVLRTLPTRVVALTISRDGKYLATSFGDYRVRVVELATGEETVFWTGHFSEAYDIAFSPDNTVLATGTRDTTIRLHDWRAEKTVRVLRGHTSSVFALDFSPDGRLLASGSSDLTVAVWDLADDVTRVFLGHSSQPDIVRFSSDGSRLWSASDRGVFTWHIGGDPRTVLRHHKTAEQGNRYPYVYGVDFSADGKRLLSAGWDCTVRVTDTATGALLKTYETPRPVFDAVWAGESIVWTSRTGLGLGLAQPGGDVERIQAKEWTRLVARPNSSEVACCGDRYVPGVRIFDVETRKFTGWDPGEAFERACWDVAYTHDGRKLALGWTDACVVVDADTGKTLQRFPLKGYGFAVAYSPDDRWLAVVEGSDILILDARTGDIANRLEGHAGEVFSLAWNPDGTRLASGGRDRVIRIWDPRTGARLLDLRGHTDYVKDLDWSPDGKTLASASGDNTARLWRSE